MEFLNKLDGYKTYILVILIILIEVLEMTGYLDTAVANSLEVFLGAGGLAGIRHGLKTGK